MPEVYSVSAPPPATNAAPPQGPPVLVLAAALGFFCTAGVHSIFTMRLSQAPYEAAQQFQQLLSNSTTLGVVLLPVAGWLADVWWGPRRTMQVGAVIIFLACLGIAALASKWEMELFTQPAALLPLHGLLAGLSLGQALLTLGILALTGLRYRHFTSVFVAFLVLQLVRGPVAASLPIIFGFGIDDFGHSFCLAVLAVVALVFMLLALRWPRPHPADLVIIPPRHLPAIGALLVALAAGTLLLQSPYGHWLLYGLAAGGFVGLLVYLAVKFPPMPDQPALTKPLLSVGAGLVLLDAAIYCGYGVDNGERGVAVARALLWGWLPMLAVVLGIARTRTLDGHRASQLLLRVFWLITGLGLVLVVGVWLAQRSAGVDLATGNWRWVPVALLLHLGTFGLLYLMPVLVSQRAQFPAMGRYMALTQLLGVAAPALVEAVLQLFQIGTTSMP